MRSRSRSRSRSLSKAKELYNRSRAVMISATTATSTKPSNGSRWIFTTHQVELQIHQQYKNKSSDTK